MSVGAPRDVHLVVTLFGEDSRTGEPLYFHLPLDLELASSRVLQYSSIYGVQNFTKANVTYAFNSYRPAQVATPYFSPIE